jgi:glycosyltransferase involved in cell wall biosynthesis
MSRTGAPKVIVNIANALDKSIYEVTIYNVNSSASQLDGEVDKDIRLTEYHPIISKGKASDNLLVKYLFKVLGRIFSISEHFKKELTRFKPDLVLINTLYHLYLSDITEEMGIKTVRYFHELESYLFSLNEKDKFRLLKSKDILWACSKKVKYNLEKYYLKRNVEVVYPLVYLKENKKTIEVLRDKPFTIISAAAVDFRKGFDLWVEVAIAALQKNNELVFEWYGTANEKSLIFSSSIKKIPEIFKNNIIYKGETQSLLVKMAKSNLFFLPSREDPFPIVCIEAISSGIPCVGFNSGGILELEEMGVASTVPLGEIEKLSEIILNYANGKKSISKEKSMNTYEAFRPKKIFQKVESEIRSLI